MKALLTAAVLFIYVAAHSQLKTTPVCPTLDVSILDGKVNGMMPDATTGQIKQALPCFTSEETETSKCGEAIFYKDKDIYFYTGRDYIEIREKFKGKLSIPLMGASRDGLFKWLGHPKIKDVTWDAFQTQYGILVLYYNKSNKINRIIVSKKSTSTIDICQ